MPLPSLCRANTALSNSRRNRDAMEQPSNACRVTCSGSYTGNVELLISKRFENAAHELVPLRSWLDAARAWSGSPVLNYHYAHATLAIKGSTATGVIWSPMTSVRTCRTPRSPQNITMTQSPTFKRSGLSDAQSPNTWEE